MAYNAIGLSFTPLGSAFAPFPVIQEGTQYSNLTTAQLTANSALTQKSVSTTSTLIEAAKARTTGMTIIVPIDQLAVVVGNQNTLSGTLIAPTGVSFIPYQFALPQVQTFNSPYNGFVLAPGQSLFLSPYNDPMYAILASGSSIVFFIDT